MAKDLISKPINSTPVSDATYSSPNVIANKTSGINTKKLPKYVEKDYTDGSAYSAYMNKNTQNNQSTKLYNTIGNIGTNLASITPALSNMLEGDAESVSTN